MKRCRRLLGVIAVLFATQLLLATNVLASTHVSGWIFSNTTWTTSGSPYILDGNTGVWSGVTLAIDPGVVVEFNAGQFGTFYVDGTLTASGTSSNHVTITSSQDVSSSTGAPGQWYRLDVTGTLDLSYTDIKYGGYGSSPTSYGSIVVATPGSASLDHVAVSDSMTSGLLVGTGSGSASADVTHSTFQNNDTGIATNNGYLSLTDGNDLNYNTNDGLRLAYTESYTNTATTVTNNTISHNGRYGIYYGSTGAFVGSSLEPTGHENNITENTTRDFGMLLYDPTLDWTNNYWGGSYTYTNDWPCWDYWPDSIQHIASGPGWSDGPVDWSEDDLTFPPDVVIPCAIDQIDAIPYSNTAF